MSILDKINSSNDVKRLAPEELEPLCDEIRTFLVESVSKTGGHLASNLGAVELSVALHRVYDSAVDRIVFDVGHQSYTHKILTGRKELFSTLRQHNGLSGFPKPNESVDDAFVAGHSSSSVSIALGMARARSLKRENYNIAVVIGDGAATGGLAIEGIENAAASGEPIVVILNDNNMSISENVGGFARLLQNMRVRPAYLDFKQKYRSIMKSAPHLYMLSHSIKENIKSKLLPDNLFSEMGFCYLGPIDGHDVHQLEQCIHWAKEVGAPVLLHVVTKKGKGYKFAEEAPDKFHGVGPFDPATGEIKSSGRDYSAVFGDTLCDIAAKNQKVVAITAAMADGTGLKAFSEKYHDRFFDVGICESHAVSMASGMAKQGIVPVFAVYSTFLQRSFDMLMQDVALLGLHVVLAVDRAGLVGNDGETHHGLFDVSYLGSVPGMTILCPASFAELEEMLKYAVNEVKGPVAVRYPRGGEGEYTGCELSPECVLREGSDISIISYGSIINEALKAADILAAEGISAEVVKLGCIKPNDFSKCLESLGKTGRFLMVEEVCAVGCVGRAILAATAENNVKLEKSKLINLGEGIIKQGKVSELYEDHGLNAEKIAACAAGMMEK